MTRRLTYTTLLAALAILHVSGAQAQDGGVRSLFSVGGGLRGLSMGGAQVGLARDAAAIDWNPAGLGRVPRTEIAFGRTSYFGEAIDETQLYTVLPSWRWGGLAVSARHFGTDGIEGRDTRNQVTDTNLEASALQLALGYGRNLGGWSLGGAVKMQREQVAGIGANGLGLDLGLQVDVAETFDAPEWMDGLAAGLVWANAVEPSIRLQEDTVVDPSSWRAGLAYSPIETTGPSVVAALDFEHSPATGQQIHAGLELRLHSSLSLRSGIDQHGPTAGAGVQWNDLQLDYVLQGNDLGAIHRVGVSWSLGGTTEQRRSAYLAAQEESLQERLALASARREEARIGELMRNAESLRKDGRLTEALEQIEVAQILAPEQPNLAALRAACWMDRARELEAHDALTDAALAYARVLDAVPTHEAATEGQARTQAESDRRAQRNEQLRQQFAAGLDAFGQGRLLEARQIFGSILKDRNDPEAQAMLTRTDEAILHTANSHIQQGRDLMARGLLDSASREFDQARQLAPELASLRTAERDLGNRRTAGSRAPNATASNTGGATGAPSSSPASTSTASSPSAPKARTPSMTSEEVADLYHRGIAASEAAESEDAIRYLELVYSAAPEHGQVRESLVREYLTLGMERFAAGELDDAIGIWQRALDIEPNDERARGYLERALRHRSRSQEIMGSQP